MTVIPIQISYAGTSSLTPSAPQQRQFFADTSYAGYTRRFVTATQDGIYCQIYTASVWIPYSSIYAAAVNALPQLTYPPQIGVQPTSSTVTHPSASYFVVSASAETVIQYQWYVSNPNTSSYYALPTTASYSGSKFSGSLTPNLTCSVSQTGSYQLYCSCANPSGTTTSSVITFQIN